MNKEESRKERKVEGCLLQAGIQFPQKDVILCGICPNKSIDTGNLAEGCRVNV